MRLIRLINVAILYSFPYGMDSRPTESGYNLLSVVLLIRSVWADLISVNNYYSLIISSSGSVSSFRITSIHRLWKFGNNPIFTRERILGGTSWNRIKGQLFYSFDFRHQNLFDNQSFLYLDIIDPSLDLWFQRAKGLMFG